MFDPLLPSSSSSSSSLSRDLPSGSRIDHASSAEQQQRDNTLHQFEDLSASSQQTRREMLQYQQSASTAAAPTASSSTAAAAAVAVRPRKTQACTRCSHLKVRCDGAQPCAKCISTDRGEECFYRLALKRGPPKGCPPRGGVRKKRESHTAEAEPAAEAQHSRVNSAGSTASQQQQQQQQQQHLQPLYDQHQTQHREPSYQATASYFSPFHAANSSPQAALRSLQGETEMQEQHVQRVAPTTTSYQQQALPAPHWTNGTDVRRAAAARPLQPPPPPPLLPSPGSVLSTPRFLSDSMRYAGTYEAPPRPSMPLRMPSHHLQAASVSPPPPPPPSAPAPSPPQYATGDDVLRHLDEATETRLFRYLITYILAHWPLWHASTITSLKALRTRAPTLWLAAIGIAAATADAYVLVPCADEGEEVSDEAREEGAAALAHLSKVAVEAARSNVLNEGLNTPTIQTTQTLLLITLVELGHGRMSSAWSLGGLACRIALDLRLNESNEREGFAASSAAASGGAGSVGAAAVGAAWHVASVQQEERRTFWCLYTLDRVLSAIFEKPALLRAQDISQPLPSASERDEFDVWLSDESARMVEPHALPLLSGTKTHALSSFRAWVGALQVMEVVQTCVYSKDARRDRAATRGAHEAARRKLVQWSRELPTHLRWDSPTIRALGGVDAASSTQGQLFGAAKTTQNNIVAPHHLTMRAWWCLVCMFLHRPWVSQCNAGSGSNGADATTPTQIEALEICVLAATEICEIMQCYESTYRSRRIPSSWPYLIFSAATTFAPLAGARASPTSPFAAQSGVLLDKCLASLERISQTWRIGRYHMSILATLERSSQPMLLGGGGSMSGASGSSMSRRTSEEEKDETTAAGAAMQQNALRRISAPMVATATAYSPLSSNGGSGPISPPLLGADVTSTSAYSHAALWPGTTNAGAVGGGGGGLSMSLPAAQGMGPALLSPGLPLPHPLPMSLQRTASPRAEVQPYVTAAATSAVGHLPSAGTELWSLMPMAMPVVESDANWEAFMAGLAR